MSYDEQRISDQIDGGLQTQKEQFSKPFIVANIREIIDGWEHFDPEGYSFSKMVEMLNEKAAEFYQQEVAKERDNAAKLLKVLQHINFGIDVAESENANYVIETRDIQLIKQSLTEYEKL